jgi:two-component system sensor histidine kinase UhpB
VAADDLLATLEQERELLCYDLHDGVAPLVVGAQMQLETCKAAFAAGRGSAQEELQLLGRRLQEAVDEVQRLIADLSLTISEDVPLGAAVRSHLTKLAEVQGWQYELEDGLGQERLDATVETMIYRVVQEALNNVANHARTDRVYVSLRMDDGGLVAAVQDWGVGFDPERAEWSPRRLGLRGMCNRARLIGGRCDIQSDPGVGTRVAVCVPGAVARGVSDGTA